MEQNSDTSAGSLAIVLPKPPRFPGHAIVLDGVSYTVPPLSMRSVKELQPEMKRIAEGMVDDPLEHLSDVARVIHAALVRNYPELQLEQLLDLVDMGNVGALLNAATGKTLQSATSA